MENGLTGAHKEFENIYHIVWITKYRYPILFSDLSRRLENFLSQYAKTLGCLIREVKVHDQCHVHIEIEIPPKLAISDIIRKLKSVSAKKIFEAYPQLRKRYWGGHLWARGYYCRTVGGLNREAVETYIRQETETISRRNAP